MKYISLRLTGFKRMLLNNVQSFYIEPTEDIQLILGSNGSGKSSLLEEFTPLPALAINYSKTGAKELVLEHKGVYYHLINDFAKSHPHSFIKDSEELNPGGTISVQRDLVKQEFGITAEIHELLTAQVGFQAMGPSQRRYWLTALADTNYDYAISIFVKLKEKARDVTGALKVAKQRLVSETSKLISKEEQNNLQILVDEQHAFLQHLIEYRKPLEHSEEALAQQAVVLERDLNKIALVLMKKKAQHSDEHYACMSDVEQDIAQFTAIQQVKRLMLDQHFADYEQVKKSRDVLLETGNESITSLNHKNRDLMLAIEGLKKQKKFSAFTPRPTQALDVFLSVYDTLTTVFTSLPENENQRFSHQVLTIGTENLLKKKDSLRHFTSELNKAHNQREHQEHQRDNAKTQCPSCSHTWSRGYDIHFYESVCQFIERTQENIDALTVEIQELEEYNEQIKNYLTIFAEFKNCCKAWPQLEPLWSDILANPNLFKAPATIVGRLQAYQFDLGLEIDIERTENELVHNEKLLVLARQIGDDNLDKLNSKLSALEDSIQTVTDEASQASLAVQRLQLYKKDVESIQQMTQKLQDLQALREQCFSHHNEVLRRRALFEIIRKVQIDLAKKEQILSEIKIQQALVTDLENQITALELDNEAYKQLVHELSPTDGLIAQGLMGFIKSFVRQMNTFIKKIWMYPLEVLPCAVTEGVQVELDYKFPIMVQNENNIIPDISKGSSAMREIVDLAFKITAMKYLGLAQSPLFIDEFGVSLDSRHRTAATQTIKSLIEQQPFTQMFMVSHYETSYGSLTNAQICVLCQNNIVIPKDAVFNKHVWMT